MEVRTGKDLPPVLITQAAARNVATPYAGAVELHKRLGVRA